MASCSAACWSKVMTFGTLGAGPLGEARRPGPARAPRGKRGENVGKTWKTWDKPWKTWEISGKQTLEKMWEDVGKTMERIRNIVGCEEHWTSGGSSCLWSKYYEVKHCETVFSDAFGMVESIVTTDIEQTTHRLCSFWNPVFLHLWTCGSLLFTY